MSRVRFRAGDVTLELSGSESFVLRQLKQLAPCLGRVDMTALADAAPAEPPPPEPPQPPPAEPVAAAAEAAPEPAPVAAGGNGEAHDEFLTFCRSHPPRGNDRQSDAALLFAYYLQRKAGMSTLRVGDLLRCCIRAGIDTRNFNRAIGTLSRRGLMEVHPGNSYRLSEQGIAAVETRQE
jgi:hypothetical protein